MEENTNLCGSLEEKTAKSCKSTNSGKITRNAFFNFLRAYRAKNPNKSVIEIAKEGACLWRKMDGNAKEPFTKQACDAPRVTRKRKRSHSSRKRKRSCSSRKGKRHSSRRRKGRSSSRKRRHRSSSRKRHSSRRGKKRSRSAKGHKKRRHASSKTRKICKKRL